MSTNHLCTLIKKKNFPSALSLSLTFLAWTNTKKKKKKRGGRSKNRSGAVLRTFYYFLSCSVTSQWHKMHLFMRPM